MHRAVGARSGAVTLLLLLSVSVALATDTEDSSSPAAAESTGASSVEGTSAEGQDPGFVDCLIQNVTPDGVYVNAGRNRGLRPGDEGVVRQDGVDIARVEVLQVTFASAILRVLTILGEETPLPGDLVEITLTREGPEDDDRSTLRGGRRDEDDGFRPLLAPPPRQPVTAQPRSLTHGRIRLRETLQYDDDSDFDYSRTQLGTSGSVERIEGSPWTLRWNGDLEYLDGDSVSVDDDDGVEVDWRELVAERPMLDGSVLFLGRQIPRALPAVGYVDGAQLDRVLDPTLRIGAIVGFKPDRDDLAPSAKEPMVVGYGTFVTPGSGELSYHGTLGLLTSLYEGKADRFAALIDHRARYGSVSLFQTAEVDFDIGAAEEKSGVTLTRFNTALDLPIASGTTLRASVDHFERPDTEAERDFLPDADPDVFFDSGSWRYALGADQRFGRRARLDGEVSRLTGSGTDDDLRWRVRGTWIGLPGSERGQASLSAFHLVGQDTDGVGARFNLFVPFHRGQVRFRPSVGMRIGEFEATDDDFEFTDYSLALDGRIGRRWDWNLSFTRSLGEGSETSTFFGSLTWRW